MALLLYHRFIFLFYVKQHLSKTCGDHNLFDRYMCATKKFKYPIAKDLSDFDKSFFLRKYSFNEKLLINSGKKLKKYKRNYSLKNIEKNDIIC